jgi:hypothetical protein
MGDRILPADDTLNLLLSYLREEGPYVLASPEDAAFYRNAERKTLNAELKKEEVKVIVPPKPPEEIKAKPKEPEKILPPPPPVPPSPPTSSLSTLLSVVAPELAILKGIPSDLIARKISERWKTKNQTAPISVLLFQEPPEQRALLEQIGKALDVYFGPARVVQAEGIEKEKQWEAFLSVADLKMVIVCDYTLWQLNNLMHFYKETPAQATRTLGNVPLFLLPDLSLYLKDPLLKRSLWKALCQKCS